MFSGAGGIRIDTTTGVVAYDECPTRTYTNGEKTEVELLRVVDQIPPRSGFSVGSSATQVLPTRNSSYFYVTVTVIYRQGTSDSPTKTQHHVQLKFI